MRKALILGAAAGAALIAAAGMQGAGAQNAARKAADEKALAEAKPAGEAVSCIQLTSIKDSNVRSDSVIDFYMRDGKIYRNTLPQSCSPLAFEERFGYRTSVGRLCSLDTITVLQSGSSIPGPTCGLGKFQPIELPEG